jgi:Uri superfamily endonuclease
VNGRIQRHLSHKKRLWWHMNYVLERHKPSTLIWAYSQERFECEIARRLTVETSKLIPRFGSSDCDCPSHLFFESHLHQLQSKLKMTLDELGLFPNSMSVQEIVRIHDLRREASKSYTKGR